MRIITGEARGAKLESPANNDTRPTLERVKEGIFSAIQFDIPGGRALDLFGGSGQMGLEAVSRGAVSAVIIDNSPAAVSLIKRNAQKCKLMDRCVVLQYDFKDYLKAAAVSKTQFDLIFLDPPFEKGLVAQALELLCENDLIAPNGRVICECSEKEMPIIAPEGLELVKTYKYSKTCISILHKIGAED